MTNQLEQLPCGLHRVREFACSACHTFVTKPHTSAFVKS
jgi:hypothetical protein